MKIRLFIITLLASINLLSYGEENTYQPKEKQIISILHKKLRPKDESINENSISCYLEKGFVHITFESYEGKANIRLTNLTTGTVEEAAATTLYPIELFVGNSMGTYELTITTSYNSYIGYFTIE